MTTHISTGQVGEEIATDFLREKGYKIITRNFRIRNGEVDIIATHKNILIFIEVKTRTSDEYGEAREAISFWKLRSLINVAQYYKLTHKDLPDALRIDAVFVKFFPDGTIESIEHMQNISQ